jgi:dihydroxyacid dehydratase/phosphogluconate dehydratase
MMAVGGSTNAVVHLLAVAGRLGLDITLDDFDRLARETPMIANLRPSGRWQMEQLFEAGGIPAVMKELLPLMNGDCITVTGQTLAENVADARVRNRDVIFPLDAPLSQEGGLAILRGNLCPDGAVIKHAAATESLLKHRGRAVVFTSVEDVTARIDDPTLEITPDSVLVMQNGGPVGAPGMPEAGNIPIPTRLLQQGVRDMVRISDARMSGTAYGTVVLHVAPESAVGGPLGLVQDGDWIELDVPNRTLTLDVPEEELARRRATWTPPVSNHARGWGRLYVESVMQADKGADLTFLLPVSARAPAETP